MLIFPAPMALRAIIALRPWPTLSPYGDAYASVVATFALISRREIGVGRYSHSRPISDEAFRQSIFRTGRRRAFLMRSDRRRAGHA